MPIKTVQNPPEVQTKTDPNLSIGAPTKTAQPVLAPQATASKSFSLPGTVTGKGAPTGMVPGAGTASGSKNKDGSYAFTGPGAQTSQTGKGNIGAAAPNAAVNTQAAASGLDFNIDPAAGDQSAQNDIESMWDEIMGQHDAGLEGQLQSTYADEALAQRRANEMGALSGASGMGGAAAAGAAQVSLGGMQQRTNVMNEHSKQGLEMRMSFLDRMMQNAERDKDRDLQAWLQTQADDTAMKIAGLQYEDKAAEREAQEAWMKDQAAQAGINPADPDDESDAWYEDLGEMGGSMATFGLYDPDL